LLVTLPARAEPETSNIVDRGPSADESSRPMRFTAKPLSLNFVAGMGTEVGELGGIAEYSVLDRLAIGAGVGESIFGESSALQLGALARFRFALVESKNVAQSFSVVGSFSEGRFTTLFGGDDDGMRSERAYWLQATLDYELQTRLGFRFTAGAGVAKVVAASDEVEVISDGNPSPLPTTAAVIRTTFGWAI
jgi:hypothetical protein